MSLVRRRQTRMMLLRWAVMIAGSIAIAFAVGFAVGACATLVYKLIERGKT